ncbi:MAG: hypothetical protein IMW96_06155 [Thermoanaerobacteraceae bacterium]|nr:hypothetical protein [Thermoanaerobacteraceae bacterium]
MESGSRRFLLVLFLLAVGGMIAVLGPKIVTLEKSPGPAIPRPARPLPVVEKVYVACGHREELPLPAGVDWKRAGKEELEAAFPPGEGWIIREEGSGRVVISQEILELCPADAGKLHLAELDGRVAVYRGPAGSSGPLERVLDVEISQLPAYWQERIRRGQAEFGSEEELGQALDSLDEYSSAYGS